MLLNMPVAKNFTKIRKLFKLMKASSGKLGFAREWALPVLSGDGVTMV